MYNEREHFTGTVIGFNIYTNDNDTKQRPVVYLRNVSGSKHKFDFATVTYTKNMRDNIGMLTKYDWIEFDARIKLINGVIPLKPELLNPTKAGLLRPSRSCKHISEGKAFNMINNYLKYRTA
ncbi:hypothetical protein ACWYVZ_08790 [Pediococcus acidilactici]